MRFASQISFNRFGKKFIPYIYHFFSQSQKNEFRGHVLKSLTLHDCNRDKAKRLVVVDNAGVETSCIL